MDLCQVEMRKASDQLFGCQAVMQDVRHDRANGEPGAVNDRASAADGWIAGDVRAQHFRHDVVSLMNGSSITEPARPVNVTERVHGVQGHRSRVGKTGGRIGATS